MRTLATLLVCLSWPMLSPALLSAIAPILSDGPDQTVAGESEIQFARDVRPILSDTCFKCHGPDHEERAAELRLDTKDGIFDDSDIVTAGDLESSELYQRIISDDEDMLMPPADSGRVLTDDQKEIIRKWIEQGAEYQKHWSFEPPITPNLPSVEIKNWASNEIDRFVLSHLAENQIQPNPLADRATLIRRVCLDLTGLPPNDEQFKKYSDSTDAAWYETLVDELLASDASAEHMTRFWLDVARYGDTHGLHLDNYREMWLYRDWVINAFKDNMPFDQFATEQLAGDLLENPTDAQLIATGFNRAHVSTAEGGSIKEEVYVRNVVDRVSTTGTVFMGLTVGCAQCHDHKFDPISQQDFYQLFAYFNSLDADPMDGNKKDHAPVLRRMDDEQKSLEAKLKSDIKTVEARIKKALDDFVYAEPEPTDSETEVNDEQKEFVWLDDEIPPGAKPEQTWKFVTEPADLVHSGENSREQVAKAKEMKQHLFTRALSPLRVDSDATLFAYVYLDPKDPPLQIMLQYNDGGWSRRAYWGENSIDWGTDKTPSRFRVGDLPKTGKWIRLEVSAKDLGFKKLTDVNGMAFTQSGGRVHWDSSGIVSSINQSGPVSLELWVQATKKDKAEGIPQPLKKYFNQVGPDKWNEAQKAEAKRYFLEFVFAESKKVIAVDRKELAQLNEQKKKLIEVLPTTLIWKEKAEPKEAFILTRGEYDQHGDKVERAVPEHLAPWPTGAPQNRLGLAKWLMSKKHPLTARVTVNRFWQQVFGNGLVKTTEDFGAQGMAPSHPELLDWLATDFVENDWDTRRLIKQMVMSSTYRQSSKMTELQWLADPENRLLGRGVRVRLDAEILRDQALAISGLLVEEVGGPSVKPPQPDGLWFVVGYSGSNTVRFKKDEGHEKVHRRSLYTFLKRTAPPPQMSTFDAPSREACSVRRERTNTPLQALLLMNDPQYVEAARFLAQSIVDAELDSDVERIRLMYETALRKRPSDETIELLQSNLDANRKEFSADEDAAKQLIAIGESPAAEKFDAAELAAWTMVANLIMNADEFVCKN